MKCFEIIYYFTRFFEWNVTRRNKVPFIISLSHMRSPDINIKATLRSTYTLISYRLTTLSYDVVCLLKKVWLFQNIYQYDFGRNITHLLYLLNFMPMGHYSVFLFLFIHYLTTLFEWKATPRFKVPLTIRLCNMHYLHIEIKTT